MADGRHARGDIWLVDFGVDPVDPEQAFIRPAVVVSADELHHPALRLVVVVPGTSTIRRLALHVEVAPGADNGLERPTAFQVEQVRAISTSRLFRRVGFIDSQSTHVIDEILRNVLRLH